MSNIQYQITPSLLNAFQNYLDSSQIYMKFWGFSDNAVKTEDEFEQEQFQNLIDSINRVAKEPSEAADKGIAFNEVIDCILESRTSDKMDITSKMIPNMISVDYNGFHFDFDKSLCMEFVNYYRGAIPQLRVEGILQTTYGDVLLYGYLDYLLPEKVCDLKTTKQYNVGKFREGWQHYVYPYCLQQMGNDIQTFEYNITDFKNTFTEIYNFGDEMVVELRLFAERFIEFLDLNKELITNQKIFNNA